MTTLHNAAIAVETDAAGAPLQLVWAGRTHTVRVHQTWTVDDQWWEARVYRAYFKLTTDSGLLAVIYQDKLSGQWFLQRVYD